MQMVKGEEVRKVKAVEVRLEAEVGRKILIWMWCVLWEQGVKLATKQTWT